MVVCVGETVDTAEAVDLAEHAKSVGADGLSSTVPVWAVGDPNLLQLTVDLYTALGEVGLPLYAYWIADTKGDWGAQDYLDAMADVPNFAGLKFTDYTFNTFQNIMSRSGYSLNVVSGPDEMMLAGKVMGAHGAIGTTYNVMPKMNVAIHNLYMAGDLNAATTLMFKCNRVIEILTGQSAEFKHAGLTLAACKAVMRELQGLPAVRLLPVVCLPVLPAPPSPYGSLCVKSHALDVARVTYTPKPRRSSLPHRLKSFLLQSKTWALFRNRVRASERQIDR